MTSSVLAVFGLLCLKQAQTRGASAWTSIILVCWSSAVVFPPLAFLGGSIPSLALLWQPAVIGGLFIAGQLLTFLAVDRGDVSIAAPVLGVKVLIVPATAPLFVDEVLSGRIWIAAFLAVIGIVFVQTRDELADRSRIVWSLVFALLAAVSMTLFDLLIQKWAPAWGAGYLLPIAFGIAALFSLALLPLGTRPAELARIDATRPLLLGAALMAIQAIGMTVTLGLFGDATRVNIVYSLRGLWGVLLTWFVTRRMESGASHRTMMMRLIGALFIGLAVIISIT